MSNAMTTVNDVLVMWNDKTQLEEIRLVFAQNLNKSEFQMLIGIGKAARLNPFLREIWAIKYGDSAAQIFIGRDGYRKMALSNPEYDYHQADAIYENDEFVIVDGIPNHKYSLNNRGKLIGAYCIVKRHNSSRPTYVFCEFKEYSTNQSLWKDPSQKGKPATMIKKVAEAQALRATFPNIFNGTYAEEEKWYFEKEEKNEKALKGEKKAESFEHNEQLKDLFTPTIQDEPFEHPKVSDEQIKEIEGLFTELALTDNRITKALVSHEVSCLEELTETKAKILINQLNKLKSK